MWFNQLMFFSYTDEIAQSIDELEERLAEYRLKPCPPHAKSTLGFDSIITSDPDKLMHTVNGSHLLALTERQRLLPSGVIKAALEEKKQAYEIENQRPMSRSDAMQAKEMLEFELLPKAFTIDKKRWFYIDTQKKWVVVNAAQDGVASDIISYIIKSWGGHGFVPFDINMSLPTLMQFWLRAPGTLTHGFQLGAQCQLMRSEEDKTSYQCKDIEAHHGHLCELLDQGFQIKSLELKWEDKLQFTLMDNFIFKKVKCLDILTDGLKENRSLENQWAQMDADMALLSGEIRSLMSDINGLIEGTENLEANALDAEAPKETIDPAIG
jgi:recombination associated protein RdgC